MIDSRLPSPSPGMLAHMQSKAWFHKDDQFAHGKVLFRSERRFFVWAYTVTHGQLLLRAEQLPVEARRSRLDVLFKPVEAMKTRMDYDGLTLRCATAEEHEFILRETGAAAYNRVFIIESGPTRDYVVSGAAGWQEDNEENRDPSALAFYMGATDPTRVLPSDLPIPWSKIQAAQDPD